MGVISSCFLIFPRWIRRCVIIAAISAIVVSSAHASENGQNESIELRFQTESLRGRVVWLAEAMERLHKVKSVPEAKERTLALETEDGKLWTIVEDLRGRSFRTDERLRVMNVELLVRKYAGSDAVQILRIHEIKNDKRYLVDYWCDVCAIIMFEMGPCDCCQDDNRLRKQLVKD